MVSCRLPWLQQRLCNLTSIHLLPIMAPKDSEIPQYHQLAIVPAHRNHPRIAISSRNNFTKSRPESLLISQPGRKNKPWHFIQFDAAFPNNNTGSGAGLLFTAWEVENAIFRNRYLVIMIDVVHTWCTYASQDYCNSGFIFARLFIVW